MKKLNIILSIVILFTGIGLSAKSLNDNKKQLTNTLGEKVSMNDIIEKDQDIIVLFWDSNNRNHIDILEDYQNNESDFTQLGDKKLIAICSDKHHNYQQLSAFIAGKDWNIDIYIDINNSYKRSKGLLDHTFYAYNLTMQSTAPQHETAMNNNELLVVIP